MAWVKRIIVAFIVIAMAYVLLTLTASELGGEVVTLLRPNADTSVSETRVWIVDTGNFEMIEHGEAGVGWLKLLKHSPNIQIRRGEQLVSYSGILAVEQHDLYHKLRREKYGVADQVIEWLSMTPSSECTGAPVVLRRF